MALPYECRTWRVRSMAMPLLLNFSDAKEYACRAGDPGLVPRSGRFPWGREWQPTPVSLPEKSRGQRRNLAGYKSVGSQRVRHD